MLKYKCIFQIKYTEAILSNSTRKLLWLEITKILIAVLKYIYCVICYNFMHTFVLYCTKLAQRRAAKVDDRHGLSKMIILRACIIFLLSINSIQTVVYLFG